MAYKLACGRVAGRDHDSAKPPLPCQDYVGTLSANKTVGVFLSDGCGSAPLSHIGSLLTVEALQDLCKNSLSETVNLDSLALRKAILEAILQRQKAWLRDPRNQDLIAETHEANLSLWNRRLAQGMSEDEILLSFLYATALFAVINESYFLTCRIGDGLIGRIRKNELAILSSESKQDAVNETRYPAQIAQFGTYGEIEIHKGHLKPGDTLKGFILFSDGLSPLVASHPLPAEEHPDETVFSRAVDARFFKVVCSAKSRGDAEAKINKDTLLPAKASSASLGDDCSYALMVDPTYQIDSFPVKKEETKQEVDIAALIEEQCLAVDMLNVPYADVMIKRAKKAYNTPTRKLRFLEVLRAYRGLLKEIAKTGKAKASPEWLGAAYEYESECLDLDELLYEKEIDGENYFLRLGPEEFDAEDDE